MKARVWSADGVHEYDAALMVIRASGALEVHEGKAPKRADIAVTPRPREDDGAHRYTVTYAPGGDAEPRDRQVWIGGALFEVAPGGMVTVEVTVRGAA